MSPWLALACVGDDPSTTPTTTGDRRGPCFADGRCNEGLRCHPTEKICVTADEVPSDAGDTVGDAANVDAIATDADAGLEPLRCGLATAPGVACPDSGCPSPNVCCIDKTSGGSSCSNECAPTAGRFECDSRTACNDLTKCCAYVDTETVMAATACTKRIAVVQTYCLESCPSPQRVACRTDGECGNGGICKDTEVVLGPGVLKVWGFCEAQ